MRLLAALLAGLMGVLPLAVGEDAKPAPAKAAAPEEGKPAFLVKSLRDYRDITALKHTDKVFIVKDNGLEISYGRFQGDTTPMKANAWDIYDVLYDGLPAAYETGLARLADEQYADARDDLRRAGAEKLGNEALSATPAYKNYIDEKLLLCSLGLKEDDQAGILFEKILHNPEAHARVRVMILYGEHLIRKGDGAKAEEIAEQLLKLPISALLKAEVMLNKYMALALKKQFADAKKGLQELADSHAKDYPSIAERARERISDIIIYHEKNFDEGIRFYKKMIDEGGVEANAATYIKLAECYLSKGDYDEGRWQLIQAFLSSGGDAERLALAERIRALSPKVAGNAHNEALEGYLSALEALYADEKKKK